MTNTKADPPIFFASPASFRKWLTKQHQKEQELLVGFYKVGSGKPSMTWSESVDEALCFGWIDGVRRSIDKESYSIRFTPRRPGSIWSAINLAKVKQLTEQGLMKPAGLKVFNARQEKQANIYSHENELATLPAQLEKKFKANKKAWQFFTKQAPSYKKVMIHWITTAKQAATQLRRLEKTIAASENKERIL